MTVENRIFLCATGHIACVPPPFRIEYRVTSTSAGAVPRTLVLVRQTLSGRTAGEIVLATGIRRPTSSQLTALAEAVERAHGVIDVGEILDE